LSATYVFSAKRKPARTYIVNTHNIETGNKLNKMPQQALGCELSNEGILGVYNEPKAQCTDIAAEQFGLIAYNSLLK
jgi:hypothetical protein